MSNSGGKGGGGVSKHNFRVTITNAITTLADAIHPVLWDTVDYDTDAGYSTVTGIYTIPTTGVWLFEWLVNINDNTSGSVVQAWLVKTPGGLIRAGATSPAAAFMSDYCSSGSAQYNATVGDQVNISYQCHEAGKTFTDGNTGHDVSEFSGFQIG